MAQEKYTATTRRKRRCRSRAPLIVVPPLIIVPLPLLHIVAEIHVSLKWDTYIQCIYSVYTKQVCIHHAGAALRELCYAHTSITVISSGITSSSAGTEPRQRT